MSKKTDMGSTTCLSEPYADLQWCAIAMAQTSPWEHPATYGMLMRMRDDLIKRASKSAPPIVRLKPTARKAAEREADLLIQKEKDNLALLDKRENDVKKMFYNEMMSDYRIASRLGVRPCDVKRWREEHGIDFDSTVPAQRRIRRRMAAVIPRLKEMRKQGMGTLAIAREFCVSPNCIRIWERRYIENQDKN